jgi:hypothetical protein
MEKINLKKFETVVLKKEDSVKIQGGYGKPTGYWDTAHPVDWVWVCID